jgi:hypothetical protein
MRDHVADDVDVGLGEQHHVKWRETAAPQRPVQLAGPHHGALDQVAVAALVERQRLVAEPDRRRRRSGLRALEDVSPQKALETGLARAGGGEVRRIGGDELPRSAVPHQDGARRIGHVAQLVGIHADRVGPAQGFDGAHPLVVGPRLAGGPPDVLRRPPAAIGGACDGGGIAPVARVRVQVERDSQLPLRPGPHVQHLVEPVHRALFSGAADAHAGDDRLPPAREHPHPVPQRLGIHAKP